MIEIFSKKKAECFVCKTPLNGEGLNEIGDEFYCQSDYEKEMEKPDNEEVRRNTIEAQRILQEDNGNLCLNHDFTLDWTATNATLTSAKVWTGTTIDGKINKLISEIEFGTMYNIKVTASTTAGSIFCYNSTDGTKLLGTNSFEIVFTALTKYIEFRNSTAATNTVTFIEIKEV